MRITHLNCGTMCPHCRRLVNGDGSFFVRGRLVCHSLLIDLDDGRSVLVDGGLGLGDCMDPTRLDWFQRKLMAPRFDPAETAVRQIEAMGRDRSSVTDIILTHLDFDHAGALADFPHARVHVSRREHEAAMGRQTRTRQLRYLLPQVAQGPDFVTHAPGAEDWLGLEGVRPLGSDVDIVMVALYGHTAGHCGVAIGRGAGRWLLHAGDSFFHQSQIAVPPGRQPPAMAMLQWTAGENGEARAKTLEKLRRIARGHGDEVRIFCSHDPAIFDLMAAGG